MSPDFFPICLNPGKARFIPPKEKGIGIPYLASVLISTTVSK